MKNSQEEEEEEEEEQQQQQKQQQQLFLYIVYLKKEFQSNFENMNPSNIKNKYNVFLVSKKQRRVLSC